MRVELELDENPGLYLTFGGATATWETGGKTITAEIITDMGGGTQIIIGNKRFRLDPKQLVASIAEELKISPDEAD